MPHRPSQNGSPPWLFSANTSSDGHYCISPQRASYAQRRRRERLKCPCFHDIEMLARQLYKYIYTYTYTNGCYLPSPSSRNSTTHQTPTKNIPSRGYQLTIWTWQKPRPSSSRLAHRALPHPASLGTAVSVARIPRSNVARKSQPACDVLAVVWCAAIWPPDEPVAPPFWATKDQHPLRRHHRHRHSTTSW